MKYVHYNFQSHRQPEDGAGARTGSSMLFFFLLVLSALALWCSLNCSLIIGPQHALSFSFVHDIAILSLG